MAQTTVFLLNGATSFPDPGSWNPTSNKVECVGSGGYGAISRTQGPGLLDVPTQLVQQIGGSGGGGAYGVGTNLAPTFPVTVNIPLSSPAPSAPFSFTYWNTYNSTVGSVWAGMGYGQANSGGGGQSGYPTGFAGGNGVMGAVSGNGPGGGGAGGPHGAGSAGTIFAGGAADGGTVAGQPTGGAAGNPGTQWDATHGVGGGGAGGISTAINGGRGGNYGGGSGCAYYPGGTVANPGGDGLLIVTWAANCVGKLNSTQDNQTVGALAKVDVGGSLTSTQADHAVSAAGIVFMGATLQVTQQPQTFAGFGFTSSIQGSLSVSQVTHALTAHAGPLVSGATNVTQADQALNGRAYPAALGSLIATQADHGVVAKGNIGLMQDSQTLTANGSVLITGAAVVGQAQTLNAKAGALVVGGLVRAQDDQTLVSYSGPVVEGKLTGVTRAGNLQVDQTLVAIGRVNVGGALHPTQQDQTLVGALFAKPYVELSGDLAFTLPFATPPLTDWVDYTGGFTATAGFGADLNVRLSVPISGNLAPSIVFSLTTLTTTPSIDLPIAGMTPTLAFAGAMTVTPAVTFGVSGFSVNVALAGVLETYDPTSPIIIECGQF